MTTKEQNDLADRETHIARVVSGRHCDPDFAGLADFLRANPGRTVRDYKGKGPSVPPEPRPWEKAWPDLKPEEARSAAIAASARDLPQNVRQAAARDPALIWNPLARKYRLRLSSDPLPGHESSRTDAKGTGGDHEHKSKHAILADRARPRVGARGAVHEN